MSILKKADGIVNHNTEEKERQYGPFNESMTKAAKIASIMCNKNITTEDFFKCMIALKTARMAYQMKEDTLMDLCAYIQGLHNYNLSKNARGLGAAPCRRAKDRTTAVWLWAKARAFAAATNPRSYEARDCSAQP